MYQKDLLANALLAISICFFSLLPSFATALTHNLRFEHVITEDQTPIGETNVVFQDHLGFIWFGGSNGLARHNGSSFEHFYHQPANPKSVSHNFVWDIIEDSKNRLWVATPSGLNYFDRENNAFIRFQNTPENSNSLGNNDIYKIFEDSNGKLWLGTREGLDLFDPETNSFTHFTDSSAQSAAKDYTLNNDSVFAIYEDSNKNIWVGTQYGGLNILNRETKTFKRYTPPRHKYFNALNIAIRDIKEDDLNYLWLATDDGLFKLNPTNGDITHYKHNKENPNSLSTDRLWNLFTDKEHNLWITTDHGGINVYRRESDDFIRYKHNPFNSSTIGSNNVRKIYQDNSDNFWFALFPSGVDFINTRASKYSVFRNIPGNSNTLPNNVIDYFHAAPDNKVWIGSEGGASLFNPKTKTFKHYYHKPSDPKSLSANAVLAIEIDGYGNQWFGTWSGGLNRFDPIKQNFQRFLPDKSKKNSISSEYIWALLADSAGNLWIGHEARGLDKMNIKTGEITNYAPKKGSNKTISQRFVRCLIEDANKNIWIGTLVGLNKYNPSTQEFTQYFNNTKDPSTIEHTSILSLLEGAEGIIWIGTEGGLSKFDPTTQTFKNYSTSDGLPHNSISSIQEDEQGNIWLSTFNGISRFNPKTEEFDNFNKENGLAGNLYSRNASLRANNGDLYFGSTQGFTLFNPSKIELNEHVPPIHITGLKVFNQRVDVGNTSPLKKDITLSENITLDYSQSMITFEFTALNYVNPNQNRYSYKLESFDKQWIDAGYNNTATYTNLNAGSYVFRVRGANDDGIWNMRGRAINVTILPPPWQTWWAYLIYALAIIGLIFFVARSQRNKIIYEQKKVEHLRSLSKLKDEFLANTSHELRTPLNGIIGLTESLIDDNRVHLSPAVRSQLKMIASSGRRLSSLINDILDFAKIRSKGLALTLKPVDLYAVIESVITMTATLAEKKGLKIVSILPEKLPAVIADEDRLQQILYNLIGNAIKFTSVGEIAVTATLNNNGITISISDTGIGIPEEQIERIFVSFSQGSTDDSREFNGTGLGLTIAKNLIELHNSKISVVSSVNRGSTFSFTLETTDITSIKVPKPESSVLTKVVEIEQDDTIEELVTEAPNTNFGEFHILVVDDDPVNRQVLVSQLSLHEYRISEACDGFEAIDLIASDRSIDLILLDVMMPRMTGYEAATRIRETHPVHELPIIFITAKHLASDLVRGFVSGGNDFLVKPISKNELLSRVKTHLQLLDITRHLEHLVEERTNTVTLAHRELERLDNIVNLINKQDSLEGLTRVLLQQILALFPKSDQAAIWLIDNTSEQYKLISIDGDSPRPPELQEKLLEPSFIHNLIRQYNEHDDDVFTVPSTYAQFFTNHHDQPDSILILLIRIESKLEGILTLVNQKDSGAFDDGDKVKLMKLHTHAVSAVSKARILEQLKTQNQQLELASYTDQLTGLLNRRHLIKNIESDIAMCDRKFEEWTTKSAYPANANLLFIIIDIDHFKIINDTHGHVAGDLILKQFSLLLSSVFRESDYLIRWGGEEFMVVVRFCNRAEAHQLAGRFKKTVENYMFDIGKGIKINKTCSLGYSFYPFYPDFPSAYSWEQVVDIADKCLYVAKHTCRNAWAGIYGNPGSSNKLNYTQLSTNLERCIESPSLKFESSFDKYQTIKWSEENL